MTKKELEQVFYISKEIEMWKKELERLRGQSLIKSPPLTGMPGGSHEGNAVENLVFKIMQCEEIIKRKIAEMELAKIEVIKFINGIEDSYTRQIVFYRNCELMSWNDVASSMGEGYTAECVRQSYKRFLNKTVTHVTCD